MSSHSSWLWFPYQSVCRWKHVMHHSLTRISSQAARNEIGWLFIKAQSTWYLICPSLYRVRSKPCVNDSLSWLIAAFSAVLERTVVMMTAQPAHRHRNIVIMCARHTRFWHMSFCCGLGMTLQRSLVLILMFHSFRTILHQSGSVLTLFPSRVGTPASMPLGPSPTKLRLFMESRWNRRQERMRSERWVVWDRRRARLKKGTTALHDRGHDRNQHANWLWLCMNKVLRLFDDCLCIMRLTVCINKGERKWICACMIWQTLHINKCVRQFRCAHYSTDSCYQKQRHGRFEMCMHISWPRLHQRGRERRFETLACKRNMWLIASSQQNWISWQKQAALDDFDWKSSLHLKDQIGLFFSMGLGLKQEFAWHDCYAHDESICAKVKWSGKRKCCTGTM